MDHSAGTNTGLLTHSRSTSEQSSSSTERRAGEEQGHPYTRFPSMQSVLLAAWRRHSGNWIFPEHKGDVTKDYELGGLLGRGQFGVVCVCTERKTGKAYACKTILRDNLHTEESMETVRNEVRIMERVQHHDNIVTLRGVYEDKHSINLVMDYCSGGTITDTIINTGKYSERRAARLMRDIMNVVKHCHVKRVVHRDIKLTNFLRKDESDDAHLIAIDFGVSCIYTPGKKLTGMEGSPFYIAPEVLNESYGPECDIWSAGICLYILLSGEAPFNGGTVLSTLKLIQEAKLDLSGDSLSKVSPDAKELLSSILTPDPSKRLTVNQILEHPWMKEDKPDVDLKTTREGLRHFSDLSKLRQLALMVPCLSLTVRHEEDGTRVPGHLKGCFTENGECRCQKGSGVHQTTSGVATAQMRTPDGQAQPRLPLRRIGTLKSFSMEDRGDDTTSRSIDKGGSENDGTLDFHEFEGAVLIMDKEKREMHLKEIFGKLEEHTDGVLSHVEMLCVDHGIKRHPLKLLPPRRV